MTGMLNTAEQMAIAVLRGDMVAALALADKIVEDCGGRIPVKSITRTIDAVDVRCVVTFDKPHIGVEYARHIEEQLASFITGDTKILFVPPDAVVEFYSFPPAASPLA